MPIGKIRRVKLREVWKHEAMDFTTWLEDNIDVLNESLDLDLTNVEREQRVGPFSADLVAEDVSGRLVIIENQLEKSDHDHLGKILTYLTALEAHAAIWMVAEPRPEHVKAIAWLNESSAASFYLVKVEAIKIGDSPPAPLLTLITGPSAEAIEAGERKKEFAERDIVRKEFWTQLLELARKRTKLHSSISPGHLNWICQTAGLPRGLSLNYVIRRNDGQVELYIDVGSDAGEQNLEIFDALEAKKAGIESAFGEPLLWERLEGKRACRIKSMIPDGGLQDEEKWPQIQEKMVDAMIRLEKALQPHFGGLPK